MRRRRGVAQSPPAWNPGCLCVTFILLGLKLGKDQSQHAQIPGHFTCPDSEMCCINLFLWDVLYCFVYL